MAGVENRRLTSDAGLVEIRYAVNRLNDVLFGNRGGRFFLQADDGTKRAIRGGATLATGIPALRVRSGIGEHLAVRDAADTADLFRVRDATIEVRPQTFQFLLSGSRIVGDLFSTPKTNRMAFQSNTGSSTFLGAIPPTAQTTAGFSAFSNANPDSGDVEATLRATFAAAELRAESPSGTFKPLRLYTNGAIQLAIDTAGIATFTQPPIVPALTPPTANGQVPAGAVCKGWVEFAGATGTIGNSYNVASVVRTSAGVYTVSWDRDFASTNYAVALDFTGAVVLNWVISTKLAGSISFQFVTAGGVSTDPTTVSAIAFGTLV